ncbi:hypothetical protein BN77_2799 [Rhizobium mesoamericanum STM3625]|uniref:Uncharacterized protein n=1 Tax=Rhizobium mesoamericanum STM3625 TaxID=1211777 RepID=K0PVQ5_9HYPH|nr:hypothetical protein BN77_2799 [Rhizobium mesoamericanum STM3625]
MIARALLAVWLDESNQSVGGGLFGLMQQPCRIDWHSWVFVLDTGDNALAKTQLVPKQPWTPTARR